MKELKETLNELAEIICNVEFEHQRNLWRGYEDLLVTLLLLERDYQ